MPRIQPLEDWPGVWECWARGYVHRNLWRVKRTMGSYEDAMAECALLFVDCRRRYGATCNSPRQFMALFQLMVQCRFNKASIKDTAQREAEYLPSEGAAEDEEERILRTLVAPRADCPCLLEASNELADVLFILFDAPSAVLQIILRDAGGGAKNIFGCITRFLGIDTSSEELSEELRRLLGSQIKQKEQTT